MDKIVHFEIPFDDKKRAMKFYSEVFGWKLTDMAEMSYVMAETVAVNDERMPKSRARSMAASSAPEGGSPPGHRRGCGVGGPDAEDGPGRGRQGGDTQDPHPRMGAFARWSTPKGTSSACSKGREAKDRRVSDRE